MNKFLQRYNFLQLDGHIFVHVNKSHKNASHFLLATKTAVNYVPKKKTFEKMKTLHFFKLVQTVEDVAHLKFETVVWLGNQFYI